jgi:hypothetical protein
MKTYRVVWEIDIDAENADEAALLALEIQRDVDSIATIFEVCEFSKLKTRDGYWVTINAKNFEEE